MSGYYYKLLCTQSASSLLHWEVCHRLYSFHTRETKTTFPNTKKYKNFFSGDCFEDNTRNSGSHMMMMSNVKLAHKKQFVRKGHFNTKSILKYHCTLSAYVALNSYSLFSRKARHLSKFTPVVKVENCALKVIQLLFKLDSSFRGKHSSRIQFLSWNTIISAVLH